ncbi:MAG: hypothetical protein ABI318_01140, partial [Chthoniobacteraceae bacterium]
MKTSNGPAFVAGVALTVAVAAGIAVGSTWMRHFDPALTGYALGTLFAAFAVGYRFALWAQRPPSRMYFMRGFQLIFWRASGRQPSRLSRQAGILPAVSDRQDACLPSQAGSLNSVIPHGAGTLGHALATKFVTQGFIRRRGGLRWVMHLCLSGGCTLAFAITFPLVFGWIHFESLPDNAEIYRVKALGLAVDQFSVHSVKAFVMFNLLNISAVIVLVGLVLAAYRRFTDAGERATQKFFEDILPLLLIFAVTVTGLALTVSYKFLAGRGHGLWAVVHMVAVASLLLYIPFGKLFHIFQRSCSLAVSIYKKSGQSGPRAHCRACGEDFASQMHV